MSEWDFLHDMHNAGYSADAIMEAQSSGLAPWDHIEDEYEEVDDLETLEALRRDGFISREEFLKRKAQIIQE